MVQIPLFMNDISSMPNRGNFVKQSNCGPPLQAPCVNTLLWAIIQKMASYNVCAARRGIALFCALVWGVCALSAQEIITAERYLEMVSERYSVIKDYEANIAILSGGTEMK